MSLPNALRRRALGLAALLSPALIAFAPTSPAAAAEEEVLHVTTVSETGGGCAETHEECSLSEAFRLVGEGSGGPGEGVDGHVKIALELEGFVAEPGELEVHAGPGVESIWIEGPGNSQLTIDGSQEHRVIKIEDAGSVKISGVEIADGAVDDFALAGQGGAGIYAEDTSLVLEGVQVSHNETQYVRDGAGVAVTGTGRLEIVDSHIDDNHSLEHYAGGVFVDNDGGATIRSTEIDHNTAKEFSGGIEARASLVVVESSISWNRSYEGGAGGIYATGLQLVASTVNGNSAAPGFGGGGVYVDGESLIVASTIADNSGDGVLDNGGGEPVTVEGSTIVGNTMASEGESLPGAGLEGEGFVLTSTVLAENMVGEEQVDCYGKVKSEGGNLLGEDPAGECQWEAPKATSSASTPNWPRWP